MIKSFEDFQTLSKDGYEAFVASGTALTKGFPGHCPGNH